MTKNDLKIIQEIGKGKSGVSFLAASQQGLVVFKEMHDEPVVYYQFSKNKVELEIDAYHILSKLQINIPKLISYSIDENYLIKEYIDGELITKKQQIAPIEKELFFELLRLEERMKNARINIDYFPANFVLKENKLFYIDYEHNPYSDEWNFTNWGIYYWLNCKGMTDYLRTGDIKFINTDFSSGKPTITDVMLKEREKILTEFYQIQLKRSSS
ncbi:conserved hypothetical protein [uncultured Paludibacter sp.]|nr:conserved hypothetical protein [uncultured Paludibacter sp.]